MHMHASLWGQGTAGQGGVYAGMALIMTHLSVLQAWRAEPEPEPEAAVLDPGTEKELGGAS